MSGASLPAYFAGTGARTLVTEGWDQAQAYASDSFASAQSFIDEISRIAALLNDIPDVDTVLSPVAAAVQAYVSPTAPVEPIGLSVNMPSAPGELVLTDVTSLDIGSVPEFTATAPVISVPTAPSALSASLPIAPNLADPAAPVEPTIVLPDVPTLLGVSVPGVPTLSMPEFAGTLAVAPSAPANAFAFTEAQYTSDLLSAVQSVLQTWVEGASTGLSAAVEQAIWDRGRTREAATAARKTYEATRDFASRGFSKPPGAMALAMQDALQAAQNADVTTSREVMVEAARLEQTNRQFAIEHAVRTESALIQYQNNVAQRAFDAAKYTQEVAISIYTAMVQGYGAQVQAYVAQAQVYKTQIEGELSKLEVYKAELEGQRLIGQLNVQSVEVYKARVSAAMSLVEIFKSRVEAANLMLQGNKIRIDGYATQVQAYDSEVRAKASEYQGFATLMQAEAIKVDMFKGQADAHRSITEGFKIGVDARAEAKRIELETNQRIPMEAFKTRAEVFRIQTEAEARRVDAGNKVFETRASVFDTQVKGEASRVGAEVEVYKAESDVAVAEANLRIEAARANIQKLMQQVGMLIEAVKAGAQVSAQMAASALSSVNLSGQIGDHVSWSQAVSASNSYAENFNEQNGTMIYHNLSGESEYGQSSA